MPPKGTPPEEKLRNIYFAVGFAMTQWQHVEQALTQLFLILLKAQNAGAASAAFASVLGFRSKLNMVESAAFVVLGKTPLFAEWTSLSKSLGRKASKRNQIAHFMLYQKAVASSPNDVPWEFVHREQTRLTFLCVAAFAFWHGSRERGAHAWSRGTQ
jgi:hypothetical protein